MEDLAILPELSSSHLFQSIRYLLCPGVLSVQNALKIVRENTRTIEILRVGKSVP